MDDKQVLQTVKTDLTWIQKHEKILIVFLALLFAGWAFNGCTNYAASHDHTIAGIAAQQLQDQKDLNKESSNQSQQAATVYQQTIAALAQQNASLASAVSARNQALANQQAKNNTAPLTDVAARWSMLAGIKATDIVSGPSGIAVTDTGARQTVNELEKVPVLQANLTDTQTTCKNAQTELGKANDLIGKLNTQVAGLNTQTVDQDKSCKAQIASVKADANKSKIRWFKAGVITGFLGGLFIGHKIP